MSLHFKTIRWKNLLSTGNNWTEIDFTSNKSTLIIGQNGAGKSTLLDALSFALYGRPFRSINKPQLINSTNQKNLEVELTFTANNHLYLIRRGMKPNVFEIYRDGKLVNVDAAIRDYQEYFEKTILKMNYKTFGQVIVLGSSTYVPFMQLPAASRREVIEDLLDIQVFSTMSTLLKEKISENKAEIQRLNYQINIIDSKLESARQHNEEIKLIKELEINKMKDKVKEHLNKIENNQSLIRDEELVLSDLIEQTNDRTKLQEQLSSFDDLIRKINLKSKQVNSELVFFHNNDNCPTCQQGIAHDFKNDKLESYKKVLYEYESAVSLLEEKKENVNNSLSKFVEIDEKISKVNYSLINLRTEVKISKNHLNELKDDILNAEKEVEEIDVTKITLLENELDSISKLYTAELEHKDILTASVNILKDGGIKTQIIKQYIPIINKLINRYLASLEFLVDFELDSEFNETIKSRFRDVFTYNSFSEGEKSKLDFALVLTWRAISKMRHSMSCNIALFDEIFDSSADGDAVDGFMSLLNEGVIDNAFVISHRENLRDNFDRVIKFEKIKGFSEMVG